MEPVKTLVLEEADETLDRGFEEQLYEIKEELKGDVQTIMSAPVVSKKLKEVAGKLLCNPVICVKYFSRT